MTDSSKASKKKKITYTASTQGIERAKNALKRSGLGSKSNFVKSRLLNRSTVNNFFQRRPIQLDSFERICQELELNWREIAELSEEEQSERLEINSYSSSEPDEEEQVQTLRHRVTVIDEPSQRKLPRKDWGDAPDVPVFFGRTKELADLEQWILQDRCRLVAIVGIGGIGKTDLSIKLGKGGIGKTDLSLELAKGIEDEFEYVIWRRLLNPQNITNILSDFIKFLSNQQEIDFSDTVDSQISRLLNYLRQHRCLLILDNVEVILQDDGQAGQYQEEYKAYGELFKIIGEVSHQSCLLLTSREKPNNISILANPNRPVRYLELDGLDSLEGRKIFE